MKTNFKAICKGLNEHAASDGYKKPAALRVEFTSFQAIHKAHRGRNGVGELVELMTRVIEAEGIHIEQWDRSTLVSVYVKARTRSSHGFGSDKGTFLRIRSAKGKYESVTLRDQWERSEIETGHLARVCGETKPCEYAAEEFAAFIQEDSEKVVKLVGSEDSEESEADKRWKLDGQRREFSKKFYQDLAAGLDQHYGKESLEKFLEFAGCKLVNFFRFTDEFRAISPEYVDANSMGIEIGWNSRETYCSLPNTLKVTKVREIKTVKLADLGIEGAGYYSHDDRMRILPEQVEAAKKFAARFRSKKSKVTERAVDAALKAS